MEVKKDCAIFYFSSFKELKWFLNLTCLKRHFSMPSTSRSNIREHRKPGKISLIIWVETTSGEIYSKQIYLLSSIRVFPRKFLSTSGDKMLTLFEDLKSSGAEAHLVEVKQFQKPKYLNLIIYHFQGFEDALRL